MTFYGNYPRTIRFELHQVRRIPVEMDEATRRYIVESHEHGRRLPQTIAELFGEHEEVERARLTYDPEKKQLVVLLEHSQASGLPPYGWAIEHEEFYKPQRRVHDPQGFDHLRHVGARREHYRSVKAAGLDFSRGVQVSSP